MDIVKIILAPYYGILRLRHRLYDRGCRKSFRAPVRTVVVGNVTVGGTGKTPFVEMLLRCSGVKGVNVAMLSRGYGRKTKGYLEVEVDGTPSRFGDEPLQIKRKFPSVHVAVDEDRLEGCKRLAEDYGVSAVILDDAFQYRRLKADVSIVLVDYSRPVYEDHLLPFGRLRDLPERLSAAEIVVVTKCPAFFSDSDRDEWRRRLRLREDQKLLFTEIAYCDSEPVFPSIVEPRFKYSPKAVVVSGIASDKLFLNYAAMSCEIEKHIAFGDHHNFTSGDIDAIFSAAQTYPGAVVLTTEKDAQRLRAIEKKLPMALRQRLFYVPIESRFIFPEDIRTIEEIL